MALIRYIVIAATILCYGTSLYAISSAKPVHECCAGEADCPDDAVCAQICAARINLPIPVRAAYLIAPQPFVTVAAPTHQPWEKQLPPLLETPERPPKLNV